MVHALMGPRGDKCVHPVYVTQTLPCVRLCPLVQPVGASLPLVYVMLTALEPAARACVLPSQDRMRNDSLGWSWESGAAHLVEG